eukprot:1865982-Rhodomonas_salina.1
MEEGRTQIGVYAASGGRLWFPYQARLYRESEAMLVGQILQRCFLPRAFFKTIVAQTHVCPTSKHTGAKARSDAFDKFERALRSLWMW